MSVSKDLFIKTWNANDDAGEVADILGLARSHVLSRAAAYRAQGETLRVYPRGRKPAEPRAEVPAFETRPAKPPAEPQPKPEDEVRRVLRKILDLLASELAETPTRRGRRA